CGFFVLHFISVSLLLGCCSLVSSLQMDTTSRGKRFNFGFLRSSQSLMDFPHALPLAAVQPFDKKTDMELDDDSRRKRYKFNPLRSFRSSYSAFTNSEPYKPHEAELSNGADFKERPSTDAEMGRARRIKARLLCAITLRSRDACDTI
uniref:Uncharacterized protein n=1 Tax=Parascaris univalens TaxID=6257 RepID=A0A915BKY1_PARUN